MNKQEQLRQLEIVRDMLDNAYTLSTEMREFWKGLSPIAEGVAKRGTSAERAALETAIKRYEKLMGLSDEQSALILKLSDCFKSDAEVIADIKSILSELSGTVKPKS